MITPDQVKHRYPLRWILLAVCDDVTWVKKNTLTQQSSK